MLQKVLQPLYFARHDTKTPFYYALAAMVVNAVIAVGLAPVIGYLAAALGTTLAAWAMVVLLWRGSRPMGEAARLDDRFHKRIWRILLAAAIMGFVLLAAYLATVPAFTTGGFRYLALAALVTLGIFCFQKLCNNIVPKSLKSCNDSVRFENVYF